MPSRNTWNGDVRRRFGGVDRHRLNLAERERARDQHRLADHHAGKRRAADEAGTPESRPPSAASRTDSGTPASAPGGISTMRATTRRDQRGRDAPHPQDDLGVLVEPAAERDAEPAPDLARQEAEHDQNADRAAAPRSCSRRSGCAARDAARRPACRRSRRSTADRTATLLNASTGPIARPRPSAAFSSSSRALRAVEVRNEIGVMNIAAAPNSAGSSACM